MQQIAEWQDVDSDTFLREIVPADKPVVMRSVVADWPAVDACRASGTAACDYLGRLPHRQPVYTIAAPPEAHGRFFYDADLSGVNFKRGQIPLQQVLQQLQQQVDNDNSHAIAVQAMSVRDVMPLFDKLNPMRLVDPTVPPTMWIGSKGLVAPHYDVHRNVACVVAGRRQFVVFPPEQVANLYPGPMLNAPGGVPISMVDIWDPDLDRYPRFRQALEAAQESVLEPGDAIYIPSLWWHGVASLEPVNVLVNYWWGGAAKSGVSPNDSLMHSMLAIADLDTAQRDAWRSYFDYFVFGQNADPTAHLPDTVRDIVTGMSNEQEDSVRQFLAERLHHDSN